MRQALSLAARGKTTTSPNPMVGSVIVKANEVIAQGWHRRCGGDHAETVALKKARDRAKGATLYITLEPCFHYGKTPPCVERIVQSGIKEVIVAMKDPNPLTNGKSLTVLRRAGIFVKVGVLRKEAQKLNEVFIKYITTGLPFVATKSAQTLDGKIATVTGDSKWITSIKTRNYARTIRDEFDAILIGNDTVIKDDPQLNGKRKNLKKIILDSTLKISMHAKLFQEMAVGQCIIATTSKALASKVQLFQRKGIQVMCCPQKDGKVNLQWLLKELGGQKISSILVEGGAHVIGGMLKAKLVDKMYIYVSPKILADQNALSSVVGRKIKNINQASELKNLDVQKVGKDILITGYVGSK